MVSISGINVRFNGIILEFSDWYNTFIVKVAEKIEKKLIKNCQICFTIKIV